MMIIELLHRKRKSHSVSTIPCLSLYFCNLLATQVFIKFVPEDTWLILFPQMLQAVNLLYNCIQELRVFYCQMSPKWILIAAAAQQVFKHSIQ